jgi:hypothetical protein
MRKYLLHRLMSPYYNGFPEKLQEGGAADFRTKIGKAAQNGTYVPGQRIR